MGERCQEARAKSNQGPGSLVMGLALGSTWHICKCGPLDPQLCHPGHSPCPKPRRLEPQPTEVG